MSTPNLLRGEREGAGSLIPRLLGLPRHCCCAVPYFYLSMGSFRAQDRRTPLPSYSAPPVIRALAAVFRVETRSIGEYGSGREERGTRGVRIGS